MIPISYEWFALIIVVVGLFGVFVGYGAGRNDQRSGR